MGRWKSCQEKKAGLIGGSRSITLGCRNHTDWFAGARNLFGSSQLPSSKQKDMAAMLAMLLQWENVLHYPQKLFQVRIVRYCLLATRSSSLQFAQLQCLLYIPSRLPSSHEIDLIHSSSAKSAFEGFS